MKSLLALFAAGVSATSYEGKFRHWMATYGIDIHPTEWIHRFENFILNDQFIVEHNSKEGSSYTLGHNKYSHMSFEEFKRHRMGLRVPESYIDERLKSSVKVFKTSNVPDEVDWVAKGGVTPVKNQGMCGSCWAFSTTGSVEGAAFVSSNKLVSLSEQELVDCDHDGDMGCGGGLMDHAFGWIKNHVGLCKEEDYTYHANQSTCVKSKCTAVTKVTGFTDVASNDEHALKAAVAQQPVSVAIEADQPEFQFYKSGVFNKSCGTKLDHGVLVVGYGIQDGNKYWKVKNSWGEDWGDKGYIYLARETGVEQGQCGVAMVPSYPTASIISSDMEFAALHEDDKPVVNVGSTVTIAQCGDLSTELVSFNNLTVTPKDPKRGQPIHFLGNGVVKTAFDSAHLSIAVKLAGQLVYSHYGSLCGKTHIPLPLGLGHIDVVGLTCPVQPGKFDALQVSLNLPRIAPEGNYEVYLTSDIGNAKQSVFCVQVKLDLNEGNDARGEVYDLLALS
ncbi:hypothetical protein DYB32_009580 [Aphanomyces invadans]|uniref:Peptidase C1A papain C-terminal domain-containing protein n=1 Tax=Aphanomyces invadans TaxID=157072 RepID=A0A3R7CTW1_9STRA|nr:hypothetical protein DYB32_009580 [Aphanomyces invadans]